MTAHYASTSKILAKFVPNKPILSEVTDCRFKCTMQFFLFSKYCFWKDGVKRHFSHQLALLHTYQSRVSITLKSIHFVMKKKKKTLLQILSCSLMIFLCLWIIISRPQTWHLSWGGDICCVKAGMCAVSFLTTVLKQWKMKHSKRTSTHADCQSVYFCVCRYSLSYK